MGLRHNAHLSVIGDPGDPLNSWPYMVPAPAPASDSTKAPASLMDIQRALTQTPKIDASNYTADAFNYQAFINRPETSEPVAPNAPGHDPFSANNKEGSAVTADKNIQKAASSPASATALQYADQIYDLLKSEYIKEPALSFAVYQCYYETAGFTSDLFLKHNNASGINFAGQTGATKGTGSRAWFKSLKYWAMAMAHELKKGSNPAAAKTLADYNARLKLNKYYGNGDPSNYLYGLKTAQTALKDLKSKAATGEGTKNKSWWSKLPWYGKGGIILGAVVITKKLLE